jgi:chemosensory pili system protein ChpA (sensor histidine kinase/response regulator)
VLRALHTLKGSARLAGALQLGELAHRMESEVEACGHDNIAAADVEALLQRFDTLQARFDTLRATGGFAPAERRWNRAGPAPQSSAVAACQWSKRARAGRRAEQAPPRCATCCAGARGHPHIAAGHGAASRQAPTRPCACARSCWTAW